MAMGFARWRFPFDPAEIPSNGVYLLFERGERAHGGDRIVRIGSHRGADNLAQRLSEHFLVENKDRSIFRKNVGRAFLKREDDPFIVQWEWDLTTRSNRQEYEGRLDRERLQAMESEVSGHLTGQCSFVVLPTSRETSARLALEAGLIATIAQCPFCPPSAGWLGQFSPKEAIQRTGLWQSQHVRGKTLAALPSIDPSPLL